MPIVVLDPGHNGANAAAAAAIACEVPDGGTKPCRTTGTQTADGYPEHAAIANEAGADGVGARRLRGP